MTKIEKLKHRLRVLWEMGDAGVFMNDLRDMSEDDLLAQYDWAMSDDFKDLDAFKL